MSRSPDFILKAMNKATDTKTGKIGAAWRNEDGSISLSLDMPIMPSPDMVFTLFPNDASAFMDRAIAKKVAEHMAQPTPQQVADSKVLIVNGRDSRLIQAVLEKKGKWPVGQESIFWDGLKITRAQFRKEAKEQGL